MALGWLCAGAAVVTLDSRIIAPVLPAIAAALGVTAGEAGYAETTYSVAYGGMQLVYGPLATASAGCASSA